MTVQTVLQPLIRRRIFTDEESAVRTLVLHYVLNQVDDLRRQIQTLEQKHGMRYDQFDAYLHERSQLLVSGTLSDDERRILGEAVMQEEDDWLDWKSSYVNYTHIDYSYQMFSDHSLLRWDNKEEYRYLNTFPHHHHQLDGSVVPSPLTGNPSQDLRIVLHAIERYFQEIE